MLVERRKLGELAAGVVHTESGARHALGFGIIGMLFQNVVRVAVCGDHGHDAQAARASVIDDGLQFANVGIGPVGHAEKGPRRIPEGHAGVARFGGAVDEGFAFGNFGIGRQIGAVPVPEFHRLRAAGTAGGGKKEQEGEEKLNCLSQDCIFPHAPGLSA